ncbi:MAG: glucan biosynthesis protein G [Methylotetracoccus sp.]
MSKLGRVLLCCLGIVAAGPVSADPAKSAANAPAASVPMPRPFEFGDVINRARELAGKPFARDDGGMPETLTKLDSDHYREIRFKGEKALWRDEQLPFQVQLFHRGFMFRERVSVNIVDRGSATRLAYSPELFDYGENSFAAPLPADLGFSGLRLHYPLHRDGNFDEVMVFLGASYFRAVGLGQSYGLSARGLAIDTGLPKAEEFPHFREFWVEKPAKDASVLTLYALLDSASVTGAYRFDIRPGVDHTVEVSNRLFFRKSVERIGIAPLTSMFYHGENTDRFMDDVRPEVHDSDGLLMGRMNGEWVWRPLNNPRQLRISVFRESNPVGFGLLTRDRDWDNYQDFDANYQLRPSAWVEALGSWGQGAIYLIEIPSDAEKYDNIVAFWVPDQPVKEGSELSFNYRIHFMLDEYMVPRGGKVVATRVGGAPTSAGDRPARRFAVDFAGETLKRLTPHAELRADVGSSSGEVRSVSLVKSEESGAWRLSFDLVPEEGKDPVELRAVLKSGADVLSETWIYQWSAR